MSALLLLLSYSCLTMWEAKNNKMVANFMSRCRAVDQTDILNAIRDTDQLSIQTEFYSMSLTR